MVPDLERELGFGGMTCSGNKEWILGKRQSDTQEPRDENRAGLETSCYAPSLLGDVPRTADAVAQGRWPKSHRSSGKRV